MRLTIIAPGSRGDVQAFVALGTGFRRAGYDVRLATHELFRQLVVEQGLEFAPLGGDPRALFASADGRTWQAHGENPLRFWRRMTRVLQTLLDESLDGALRASEGADEIISPTLGFLGYHLAEALGIPCAIAALQPFSRTRAFPAATLSGNLGGTANWLTHVGAEAVFWFPFHERINRWRRDTLGLSPLPVTGPYRRLRADTVPFLYGFSPSVVPKPPDWPPHLCVTGYWFSDLPPAWRPPPDLVEFLRRGPPPIYVGFGSTRLGDERRLTETVLAALGRTGQRAVLGLGWGGLQPDQLTADVCAVDDVPLGWLYPRMAAVVHHGGAGTTALGLRAGLPTVTVPFFADQPYWARRAWRAGVGPAPIPYRQLSVERLARAIDRALHDPALRARADALGATIRAEDGRAAAVAAVDGWFNHR